MQSPYQPYFNHFIVHPNNFLCTHVSVAPSLRQLNVSYFYTFYLLMHIVFIAIPAATRRVYF